MTHTNFFAYGFGILLSILGIIALIGGISLLFSDDEPTLRKDAPKCILSTIIIMVLGGFFSDFIVYRFIILNPFPYIHCFLIIIFSLEIEL
ncbi:hypothetical protein LCGC14_0775060 [marine sediment metagenome]|uniref:Uncharacterized protein n=1 Tax=marine sediment metagenome TaxID=412755 RepID=A0A0F9T451_9ZZZZ